MSFISPQPCSSGGGGEGCCPETFTGFCLVDETPISIVLENGINVGWTNLLTGVFTPGPPPAGTHACVTQTIQVDLNCETDSITVCQSEDWIVDQGTSPWVIGDGGGSITVDAVNLDIRSLDCVTDSITVCQGTDPWTVDGTVTVLQGTDPWTIEGTVTPADNFVSIVNSTTTPLAGGGAFIGTYESTLPFVEVGVVVFSDVASATDGLRLEQSVDGINFVDVDVYSITGGQGKQYTAALNTRFFRVTYTNGPVAQTDFTLGVLYRRTGAKPSSHRINDTIVTQDDAELVKAVLSGQNSLGSFTNIGATTLGHLFTRDQSDYAEDTLSSNGDIGGAVLGVRNDAGVAKTTTDGDYSFFATDAAGRIGIADLGGSVTVDGTVNVITNFEYNEDNPHVSGDTGAFVLAVRNDAGTPLASDGEYIPLTTDATGALRVTGGGSQVPLDCTTDSVTICPGEDPIIVAVVTPFDIRVLDCLTDSVTVCQGTDPWTVDGTVELGVATLAALETITVLQGTSPWVIGDGGSSITVDGTVTVNQGTSPWVIGDGGGSITVDGTVTADTNFDYAEDSPHVSGDIGAFILAVRNDAGTPLAADQEYIPFTTDATGALRVTGGAPTIFQHEEVLCDDDIPFVRKYIQDVDGDVTSVVDFDLEGDPYVVTGTVQLCSGGTPTPPQSLDSTVDRLTGAGSINVSAGSKSVTVIVISGVPTVEIDADPPISLISGLTLSWGVDARTESLLNAFTFTGLAGDDFVVITSSGPLEASVLDSTIERLVGVGSVVISAGASSITVVVVSGLPTLEIGGGPSVVLVPGMSLSWAVDADDEDLSDSFTFTGVTDSDFIVTTTRL